MGMGAEAARLQGQQGGRNVLRQRSAGLHRRAQEPEGWRRHRARDQATSPLRDRDAELIGAPQIFNVTHLLDYWYGVTWNASRREMARWKQKPEETYRFAVQAFFERTDFLRTLQHWVLFYVQDSETRKSVLRQHQQRAIDTIVARCA